MKSECKIDDYNNNNNNGIVTIKFISTVWTQRIDKCQIFGSLKKKYTKKVCSRYLLKYNLIVTDFKDYAA